jgi:putative DNA primase/helicase
MAFTSTRPANTAGAVDNGPHSTERLGRPLNTLSRSKGRNFQHWPDSSWLHAARAILIQQVIEQRGIKLRGRIERVGPCPRCGGHDRFAININKQKFNCRGCKRGGGDAISLVMFLDGVDCFGAVEILTGQHFDSITGKETTTLQSRQNGDFVKRQRAKARYLWRTSKPAAGTIVEKYLIGRGVTMPPPATVRFLSPHKPDQHPAMIVAYGVPDEPEHWLLNITENQITAVQFTLLKPDGSGKADVERPKFTVGSPSGLPMVLAAMNDGLGLAITEGVEDALSVHQTTGLGVWAAGGANFMAKLAAAVPAYTDSITIYGHADANQAGQNGAHDLATALIDRGFEVMIEGVTP